MDEWTCHICKRKRPDSAISVFTKPLIIRGMMMGQQNIRYCNDNADCRKGAEVFNFVPSIAKEDSP